MLVDSVEALESVLGLTPPAMHLKVIDYLDAGALRWLAESPVLFAGIGDAAMALAGGAPGFIDGDAATLRVPLAAFDSAICTAPGAPFGGLFLLPGVGETLRVNGRVESDDGTMLRVAVGECYGHCAKAMIRSGFWQATPVTAPEDAAEFIAASRFLALGTTSLRGAADVSPKGDPAGCMAQLDGDTLWFVDRPGNKRIDSFRNIVGQPRVALALLVPGATRVALVRGVARLITDAAARERFAVRGRTPQLAIGVAVDSLELQESAALRELWPVVDGSEINAAKLFVEHIKLNKTAGAAAMLARASLAVPGASALVQAGLDKDYRDNLY
jgi:predicted pyridoxine 5'-phosphate oxidase superfamily flavin-nucleotide-binding protein